MGPKYEEEDLDNVVVTLEVAECWVSPEDIEYDLGKLLFPPVELFL